MERIRSASIGSYIYTLVRSFNRRVATTARDVYVVCLAGLGDGLVGQGEAGGGQEGDHAALIREQSWTDADTQPCTQFYTDSGLRALSFRQMINPGLIISYDTNKKIIANTLFMYEFIIGIFEP